VNKKNFDLMMNKFCKVFERTLDAEVLAIYFNMFNEIPDSQVNTIIRNCLKKCHYFPRPADVFSSYDETAMESHKVVKIVLTEEQREQNLQRIRRLQEDLKKVREPEKIGDVIKDLKIKKEVK